MAPHHACSVATTVLDVLSASTAAVSCQRDHPHQCRTPCLHMLSNSELERNARKIDPCTVASKGRERHNGGLCRRCGKKRTQTSC